MPDWGPHIRSRLASLRLSPAREDEILEELTQHLDDRWRELIAGGASEEDATRLALAGLRGGTLARNMAPLRQAQAPPSVTPGVSTDRWVSDLGRDVRYAIRTFRRQPWFAVTCIVMLALCTGANTAIYSVVRAVLFASSYRDPSHVVQLTDTHDRRFQSMLNAPADEVARLGRMRDVFDSVAGFSFGGPILSGLGDARRVSFECVSPAMFDVLKIQPARGRAFATGDDGPGAAPVVVVSDGFWRSVLGARDDVVGRALTFNGQSVTVLGVMPSEFDGVRSLGQVDGWAPLEAGAGRNGPTGCTGDANVNVYARVRSDLTVDAANARLSALTGGARGLISLKESSVGDDRAMLLLLLGAVGFVLLIGCANIANLLLGRLVGRRREIAMRLALGASAARIVQQLVTESLVLALAGTGAGLLVAEWSLASLVSLMPGGMPRLQHVAIDGAVMAASLGAGVVAGLLAGVAPAWQARSRRVTGWLNDARGATARAGTWPRRVLVIVEVALSFALVIGAALVVRTFLNLRPVDPGFDPSGRVVVEMRLTGARYQDPSARIAVAGALVERLSAVPGVERVGLVNFAPFSGAASLVSVASADHPAQAGGRGSVWMMPISPNFFDVMRIRLDRGRSFEATDTVGSPEVAIVNDVLARQLWGGRDPIGQTLSIASRGFDPSPIRVVGVAMAIRTFGGSLRPMAQLYLPFQQQPSLFISAIVQTAGAEPSLSAALRREAADVDRSQVVTSVRPLDQILSESAKPRTFMMSLMTAFAVLALGLAVTGLAAVVGSSVAERTKEIGIRMALGASAASIARLVVGQAAMLGALGVAAGIGIAVATTRFLAESLYGVTPLDAPTFVSGAALMLLVTMGVSAGPALRAARVDPLTALRDN